MLNWENLIRRSQDAATVEQLFDLCIEELATLQRLYEVHGNFVRMVERDTDRPLLIRICKNMGLDTKQPPVMVYEEFSVKLKELKDRVVKIVKDLIEKMKDVANNILNGPSLEQIKVKIEANGKRVDALEKLIGGNADITAKLATKMEKRNQGDKSVNYMQAELEALVAEFKNTAQINIQSITTTVDSAKNVANANPEASGGTTTQKQTTTTTTTTTADTTATAQPSYPTGGTWDMAGLKSVQAASDALVPYFKNVEAVGKAMTDGVVGLNGALNGIGSDDSDSAKLKAVTGAIKEIKDRHSKITKTVKAANSCVGKITSTIDAFESATK